MGGSHQLSSSPCLLFFFSLRDRVPLSTSVSSLFCSYLSLTSLFSAAAMQEVSSSAHVCMCVSVCMCVCRRPGAKLLRSVCAGPVQAQLSQLCRSTLRCSMTLCCTHTYIHLLCEGKEGGGLTKKEKEEEEGGSVCPPPPFALLPFALCEWPACLRAA